ncbi:GIY-YIG nuclease family protein [Methylobacterium sp. WL120]|uniref:GIY-YIG nuclease family protein n=1 Tax=Methylobacterium sp. WL120 TaxID=2603887 RepID=UPI0011C8E24D|nr:GIY-YIG nuclease family protein [Methylobacterium sp. WL120]TXM69657.1 GIY-YIG nuclease family protein [Methylobacterium sp. WL120]
MAEENLKHDLAYGLPFFRKQSDLKLFSQLGFACVYAIGPEGGGPVKIGWTENPKNRYAQLQNAHWKKLEIREITWTVGRPLAIRLEGEIHKILKGAGRHLRGEWFDVPTNLVLGAFQVATDRHNIPTFTHDGMIERFMEARDMRAQALAKRVLGESQAA